MKPDYDDPYSPDPNSSRDVCCIHCARIYPEREVRWRKGARTWSWTCKFDDCDGAGVGIDLWVIDGVSHTYEEMEQYCRDCHEAGEKLKNRAIVAKARQ